jgi:hypothetical protein
LGGISLSFVFMEWRKRKKIIPNLTKIQCVDVSINCSLQGYSLPGAAHTVCVYATPIEVGHGGRGPPSNNASPSLASSEHIFTTTITALNKFKNVSGCPISIHTMSSDFRSMLSCTS